MMTQSSNIFIHMYTHRRDERKFLIVIQLLTISFQIILNNSFFFWFGWHEVIATDNVDDDGSRRMNELKQNRQRNPYFILFHFLPFFSFIISLLTKWERQMRSLQMGDSRNGIWYNFKCALLRDSFLEAFYFWLNFWFGEVRLRISYREFI